MGCSQSQPSEKVRMNGVDLKDVSLGVSGSNVSLSQRTSARRGSLTQTEVPELQSKLEKLDEERTRVQEELRRLQSAAALEQDAEMPEGTSNGEKPLSTLTFRPRVAAMLRVMLLPRRFARPSASASMTVTRAAGKSSAIAVVE